MPFWKQDPDKRHLAIPCFGPFGSSFHFILAFWAFISFHFGILGLHLVSFWPFWAFISFCPFGRSCLWFHFGLSGPSFHFTLAFWAFISFHFCLLGLHFLSFWPFWRSFAFILAFGPSFLSFWSFGPSFRFILVFWAFISFCFGFFHFLSFWLFEPSFLCIMVS